MTAGPEPQCRGTRESSDLLWEPRRNKCSLRAVTPAVVINEKRCMMQKILIPHRETITHV